MTEQSETYQVTRYAELVVRIYDCERGFGLPMHTHDPGDEHISIIAKGSFVIRGPNWEIIARCGDIIDFVANQEHEIEALEPGSRVVNIYKFPSRFKGASI